MRLHTLSWGEIGDCAGCRSRRGSRRRALLVAAAGLVGGSQTRLLYRCCATLVRHRQSCFVRRREGLPRCRRRVGISVHGNERVGQGFKVVEQVEIAAAKHRGVKRAG